MDGFESKWRTPKSVPAARSRLAWASLVFQLVSSTTAGAALALPLLGVTACSSGSSGPAPGSSSGSGGDPSDASGASSSSGSGGSSSGSSSGMGGSSSGPGGNCPLEPTTVTFMLVSGDASRPGSFELPFVDCTLNGMGNCETGRLECKYSPNSIGFLASLDLTGDFTLSGSMLTAPAMNGPVMSKDGFPLHCTYSATAVLP